MAETSDTTAASEAAATRELPHELPASGARAGVDDYEMLMIGGLVTVLAQEFRQRVARVLVERGFEDYRPTEGSRLTELAERALVTKQSMGETIDALERLGYVERVPDPRDGRAMLIRRTARGWEANRVAVEVVRAAQREWAAVVGGERYAQTLSVLREIVRTLDRR
jgi:DNA-binding MarR family transcriptional regulator